MGRTSNALALLAVLLLLLSAGCYTVLQHPTGSSIASEDTYYRSCADCHADAAYYHPFGHPYYTYGRSHYRWGSYYGSPWWYDNYWWWDDHHDHDYDHEYDGPEIETGTRHLWGAGGWPSSGWGFSPPGTGDGTAPSRPVEPPDPPKLKKEERRPEKQKQKPPKPVDLRPETEKEKEKGQKGSEPAVPDEQDGQKKEKVRPRKNPNRGS